MGPADPTKLRAAGELTFESGVLNLVATQFTFDRCGALVCVSVFAPYCKYCKYCLPLLGSVTSVCHNVNDTTHIINASRDHHDPFDRRSTHMPHMACSTHTHHTCVRHTCVPH